MQQDDMDHKGMLVKTKKMLRMTEMHPFIEKRNGFES